MLDMTKPYEGICEMLKSLKEKGVKLAVVSNKPDEFVGGIVKKYFGDTFEIVHGQRTKTNARTRKGKARPIAGKKK